MKNKVDELTIESYRREATQYAEKIVEAINDLDMDDDITLMVIGMVMCNTVGQVMPKKEHIDEFYKELAVETHKTFDFYKGK